MGIPKKSNEIDLDKLKEMTKKANNYISQTPFEFSKRGLISFIIDHKMNEDCYHNFRQCSNQACTSGHKPEYNMNGDGYILFSQKIDGKEIYFSFCYECVKTII